MNYTQLSEQVRDVYKRQEKYIERKSEEICVITNAGYKVVE